MLTYMKCLIEKETINGCNKKLLFLLYLDLLAIFYLDNDRRRHLMTPLNWSVIMVTPTHSHNGLWQKVLNQRCLGWHETATQE